MIRRYLEIWKWLWLVAVGLMLFGVLGPLSDPWDRVSIGVGVALSLAHLGADWWDRRQRQTDQSSSAAISSSDQT